MLHVVFLSPHSDPQANLGEPDAGGQCVYEHELATALSQKEDIKVTTFCRQSYRQRKDREEVNKNYSIVRIECGEKEFIPKEDIDRVLPEFTKKVCEQIERLPDLVLHGHYWDGAKACLLLKALLPHPLPFVWTPHSLGWLKRQSFVGKDQEMTYRFIPRITWENYGSFLSNAVIVSSDKEKRMIQKEYSLGKEIVHVIPPGVDMSALHIADQKKARTQARLPVDGKIILCIGRMARTKGYQYAIETLAQLKKLYSEPVYVVICGGNPETANEEEKTYLQELHEKVLELQLEKDVIFHIAVSHEDVSTIYSAADALFLTSENEPFGLTATEAMAMKLPVVASKTAGIASVVAHNQTAILVDVHQPEKTAFAFRALFKDALFYQKISRQAYSYVHEQYNWGNIADRFIDVYRYVKGQHSDRVFRKWIDDNHFLQKNLLS